MAQTPETAPRQLFGPVHNDPRLSRIQRAIQVGYDPAMMDIGIGRFSKCLRTGSRQNGDDRLFGDYCPWFGGYLRRRDIADIVLPAWQLVRLIQDRPYTTARGIAYSFTVVITNIVAAIG